jgi:hypothetical protein
MYANSLRSVVRFHYFLYEVFAIMFQKVISGVIVDDGIHNATADPVVTETEVIHGAGHQNKK